jgi:hypothetical protein
LTPVPRLRHADLCHQVGLAPPAGLRPDYKGQPAEGRLLSSSVIAGFFSGLVSREFIENGVGEAVSSGSENLDVRAIRKGLKFGRERALQAE